MKKKLKKVIKHLKGDIKSFTKEASEDRELIKELKHGKKTKRVPRTKQNKQSKKTSKRRDTKKKVATGAKFKAVMKEFGEKKLRSGSRNGPLVINPKQALAISFSEQRRAKNKRK